MKKIIALVLTATLMMSFAGCANNTNGGNTNGGNTNKNTSSENTNGESSNNTNSNKENSDNKANNNSSEDTDAASSATPDATTSASIVPEALLNTYAPKGFTESDSKKALFVVGDPRKDSVNYDMVYTAMKHLEENGVEVEIRDLYDMNWNPVVAPEEFFYAKDGTGEPSADVKTEQEFVTQADYLIFAYPNWHDTQNAILKGYQERVFAKTFAYANTEDGLAGLLEGKGTYTINNAGFLGGGRGYIGNGVGIDDAAWDSYMNAFKVLDDDIAGFWGTENLGRFVNDRTPANASETYEQEINELRDALKSHLDTVFLGK